MRPGTLHLIRIISIFLIVFSGHQLFAQNAKLDSLKNIVYSGNEPDTVKVRILIVLAKDKAKSDTTAAFAYLRQADAYARQSRDPRYMGWPYLQRGFIYLRNSRYELSKQQLDSALLYFKNQKNCDKYLADAYNTIGSVYYYQSDYEKALENYLTSLEYREKTNDEIEKAKTLNNIGSILYQKKDFERALEYQYKALAVREKLNDKVGIASGCNNIGLSYTSTKQYDKAISYLFRGLAIAENQNDKTLLGNLYNNIGLAYTEKMMLDSAFFYLKKSEVVRTTSNDLTGLAYVNNNLGKVELDRNNLTEALRYYQRSLEVQKGLGTKLLTHDSYLGLYKIYERQKDYEKAYEALYKYNVLKDSILNVNMSNQIAEKEAKYQNVKKKEEIRELMSQQKIDALTIAQREAEKKVIEQEKIAQEINFTYQDQKKKEEIRGLMSQQKIDSLTIAQREAENLVIEQQKRSQQIGFTVGLSFLAIISLLIYRSYRQKRLANEIISSQKAEVEHQRELLQEKNTEILDSISYAKRLQDAILPPRKLFAQIFPHSFILYKPKDIVAGDFYWMDHTSVPGTVFVAVADCTGHGVPGAMVSVVCVNAMNRALKEFAIRDTGKILDKVAELVELNFSHSGDEDVYDGMDISLCKIDLALKKINWSGANNPLLIVRRNPTTNEVEPVSVAADKQPVGKYYNRTPFVTHEIQLEKNDIIYLFSDGFSDQFGGKNGKKLKFSKLRELLVNMNSTPLNDQSKELDDFFNNWKGKIDQIDDVCVMGICV